MNKTSGVYVLIAAVAAYLYFSSTTTPPPENPAPVPVVPVPGPEKPVVYMFSANWCPHCKRFESQVLTRKDVKDALNPFDFRVVNSDTDRELVKEYNVTALPTFVRAGDKARHVGGMTAREFTQWLTH